ncbi:MAG: MBL fold metallo-hydrolase [Acidobacteria bacterium]|nr:MBL fold metallo-hydrolase [Acidobacteriota bacterium]
MFWQQFARDLGHDIEPAPHKPKPKEWPDTGLHAAWLGHSTVLLKIDGFHVLTDPVFSTWIGLGLGPLTLGLKRIVEPALAPAELPRIDLILLSHAHMDHFDLPTLRTLESGQVPVVTARGTSDLLRVDRYKSVQEIGWGETARVGPVEIQGFEVNHWGARMRSDTWRGYNGYVIRSGKRRVVFAGDTAMTHTFQGLGGADLAIMPIGAYNPWIRVHCNPEQAWQMANDARADRVLPVHHHTFTLSREPIGEPLERLLNVGKDRVALKAIGEEARIS